MSKQLETLKNSHDMKVQLGNYGTVRIGHLDRMGSANEILAIGNQIREEKGLKPKKLDTYLRRKETWEKIIKLYNVSLEDKNFFVNSLKTFSANAEKLLYTTLEDLPKESQGRIKYSEVLRNQQLNHIVKIQNRGKLANRGTWFELVLLLDFATWLDVDLWYEVYSTFVSKELLVKRDEGGVSFKKLNNAIDTLPDRTKELKPKGNKGVYINVAKLVRDTLFPYEDILKFNEFRKRDKKLVIWNSPLATAEIQAKRGEIEDKLVSFIEMGFITSYPQLKHATLQLLKKY